MAAVVALFAWANAPEAALATGATADRIVVEKSARRLTLYSHGAPLKSYRVSLGAQPQGAKQREGDNKTPEGIYRIDFKNAGSGFHKALHVSYPSPADRARAAAAGVSPGGDVMIHGLPNGLGFLGRAQRFRDWTAGCIALTDRDVDEVWRAVPAGTPVEIRP
ncbi:MAG TPA: L,D-transpeptidase family protein [Thermoanaerobaculia bacterium]|nr:L,D-transpeptidase family protein [Thermoanaerobaculia bacterium]